MKKNSPELTASKPHAFFHPWGACLLGRALVLTGGSSTLFHDFLEWESCYSLKTGFRITEQYIQGTQIKVECFQKQLQQDFSFFCD